MKAKKILKILETSINESDNTLLFLYSKRTKEIVRLGVNKNAGNFQLGKIVTNLAPDPVVFIANKGDLVAALKEATEVFKAAGYPVVEK